MDKKFLLAGLGYAILGMLLGIVMAASQNHGQHVTHAHILLLGFVVSFIYALCHKLWLNNLESRLARVQFYLHQAGSLVLFVGLFLLYGAYVELRIVDPILAVASLAVLAAMVIMKVMIIQALRVGKASSPAQAQSTGAV